MSIETPWANDAPGGTKLNATRLLAYTPLRGSFTNPNGNVIGSPGNTYLNTTGGAGTTLWVKESGVGTNTGWVASGTGSGGTGPAGPTGPQGPVGPTGPQGPAGTAGSGAAVATLDEGATLTANTTQYNFTGAGVTATNSGGNVTVAVPGGGGLSPTLVNTQAALISATSTGTPTKLDGSGNFGGEVLTADLAQPTGLKWSFPAYGGIQKAGTDFTPRIKLNFIGSGVTVADSGGFSTDVTIGASSSGSQIAYTIGGYTGATTGYVPIPADGSGPYTVTLTQNTSIRISDVTSESWTRIEVVIKQDATGGWTVEFAPGTIHWVGNTSSHFDSADSNWSYGLYPPGTHYSYPIIDPTPYSATIIRLTWMGSLLGYMGEVVTHIQPLYKVMPATWLNSISGTTVTVGLPVRMYRGIDQSSINTFMDLLTDPVVCSAATRTAMASHGGTYDFCRQGITDTLWFAGYRPNYEYAGANVVGSDGKTHSALSSPGFGGTNATYPPDWGIGTSYGGVWHEGSHLEDATYYATNGNPEGTTYITQLTTVVNVFNACYSITTVGMIVFMTGTVTGGTFTLMFKDSSNTFQTTSAIAWNATAATVQAALAALPNIGAGNVVCSGGPLPNTQILVQFQGSLPAFQPNTLMLGNDNNRRYSPQSLTGTTPLVRTGRNEPNGASKSEWYAEMRKFQRYTRAGGAYVNPDSQLPDYQSSQTDMVGWSRSGPAGYVLPSDRTGAFNTYMNTIIPIP